MNTIKNLRYFGLALALALAGCAGGRAALRTTEREPAPYYLSGAQAAAFTLPPPPAPGSDGEKADFAELEGWQAKRTPAQCAAAMAQQHAYFQEFGFPDLFRQPLPPAALEFFARVRTEADVEVGAIKNKYARRRPFHTDAKLDPCLGRIGGLAYPSGHATISHLYALLLADLAPARRAEFLAVADQAALNRVIGGVHHPTDVEAGKALAEEIYPVLSAAPKFKADMDMLRGLMLPQPSK
jgi:acid phosphatase (class A)